MNKETHTQALANKLAPVVTALGTLDLTAPHLVRKALQEKFPVGDAFWREVKELVRVGVANQWLCDRENAGIKFSRIQKAPAPDSGFVIDCVHMNRLGGGAHQHPKGEVSMAFCVDGDPRFDGWAEGWVVYGPRSWHVPVVSSGAMDIVYFLPGGAMIFGDRPK